MEKEKRLLPGDFQRKIKKEREHYQGLDCTDKDLEQPKAFFTVPEDLKGEQDVGQQEFLVFYFRDKKEYQLVLEFFEKQTRHAKVHPEVYTEKLVKLVKQQINKTK